MAGHPQADKLRLTERLPRRPGVYLFRDRSGRVLYVGKATNLRSRVRSYFSTDERRKIGSLLRETGRIDHKVCPSTLEAAVLEARLIRALEPRYNSHGTRWQRYPYLKLTLGEPFPRLSVVRAVRDDGGLYLGPLRSTAQARLVAEAIESVVPLRRCTQPVRKDPSRSAPCAAAQLGVSVCPCAGDVDAADYARQVDRVVAGLTHHPRALLDPLHDRMQTLADDERFEEAADTRERLAALASALRRQRRQQQLLACERLVLRVDSGERAELRRGVLWQMWETDADDRLVPARAVEMQPDQPPDPSAPVSRDLADELACVGAWLDRHAGKVRIEAVRGPMTSPLPRLPDYQPVSRRR